MLSCAVHDEKRPMTLSKWCTTTPASDLFNCACSLRHHHFHELLVIDLPVPVHVGLADHLVHFFVGQLLPEIGHHVSKLCCADEAIAVAIEDFERLDQLLLRV